MSGEKRSGDKRRPEYPQTGVAVSCRSYREYMAMFALTEADLRRGAALDVAGGASSFTAALHARGIEAFAADPFYGGACQLI